MKQGSISSEFSELDWTTKPVCVGAVLLLVQGTGLNRKSGDRLLQNSLRLYRNGIFLRKRELQASAPRGRSWDPVSRFLIEHSSYYDLMQKFGDITTSIVFPFFVVFFVFIKKKKGLCSVRHLASERIWGFSAQLEERLNLPSGLRSWSSRD